MKYCPNCGAPTQSIVPPLDNRLRDVCFRCDSVFYKNPKIVTAAIPVFEDKVLLCRRAIGPRTDCWTLPGGFMECGETVFEAAIRETFEEACAEVVDLELYLVANVIEAAQVHIVYRARLQESIFGTGDETFESRLFAENEIPWHLLSFRPIFYALDWFFKDRKLGTFTCREMRLPPLPKGEV